FAQPRNFCVNMFGSSRRGGSSRSAASSLRSGGSAHGGSNRDDAVQPLSEENVVKATERGLDPTHLSGGLTAYFADAALIRHLAELCPDILRLPWEHIHQTPHLGANYSISATAIYNAQHQIPSAKPYLHG
ncbi:MAG: hypothetical protein ACPHTH_05200, partial [Candidatus Poseidoniaceae archaeon]